jgi:Na+/H+-dicarboxylate symporter
MGTWRRTLGLHLTPIVILILGGLVAAVGLAEVPRGWIVAGPLVLTLAGHLAVKAAQSSAADSDRIGNLWGALACLVVFILGIAAYNLRV